MSIEQEKMAFLLKSVHDMLYVALYPIGQPDTLDGVLKERYEEILKAIGCLIAQIRQE